MFSCRRVIVRAFLTIKPLPKLKYLSQKHIRYVETKSLHSFTQIKIYQFLHCLGKRNVSFCLYDIKTWIKNMYISTLHFSNYITQYYKTSYTVWLHQQHTYTHARARITAMSELLANVSSPLLLRVRCVTTDWFCTIFKRSSI